MTTIIFSKDRAMQLDAFLRSYEAHVDVEPVHVLWRATTIRHHDAYAEVFRRHPQVHTVAQWSFKDDLLGMLPTEGCVVFFVDDQVFIRDWAKSDVCGLSLRLAPHLTRCYPLNAEQPLPKLVNMSGIYTWPWADGQMDWGYPLSLDGHVFDAAWIRSAVMSVDFHSPNALETELQRFLPVFRSRYGICYDETRVVNIPWNRVQTDCENRYAGTASEAAMVMHWDRGMQIKLSAIDGVINESAHQEFPLIMEPRA